MDLDSALQTSLQEFEEAERNRAIQEVEQFEPEDQLLQQAIEESKRQYEDVDAAILQSLSAARPQSVEYVMQAGFSEEQALQAWQLVGDDPGAMLEFLLNDEF